jgi:Immunoglobulin I-set domain.
MIKAIEPAGQTHVIKKGSPLNLNCDVTGYPPPTVQWTKKVSGFILYSICGLRNS